MFDQDHNHLDPGMHRQKKRIKQANNRQQKKRFEVHSNAGMRDFSCRIDVDVDVTSKSLHITDDGKRPYSMQKILVLMVL